MLQGETAAGNMLYLKEQAWSWVVYLPLPAPLTL